jgi:hypothetical protein
MITNKTRQVLNATETSGAADSLRFITFCSYRISAINKGLHVLVVVAFNSLLFIPFMAPW